MIVFLHLSVDVFPGQWVQMDVDCERSQVHLQALCPSRTGIRRESIAWLFTASVFEDGLSEQTNAYGEDIPEEGKEHCDNGLEPNFVWLGQEEKG